MDQHIDDWDKKYLNADTPWEDDKMPMTIKEICRQYIKATDFLIDIGCGYGIDTIELSELCSRTLGVDISPTAIKSAKIKAKSESSCATFKSGNILLDDFELTCSVVYDRGCLHSFITKTARKNFTEKIMKLLPKHGKWISVCGSKDNHEEDPKLAKKLGYPRLTLEEIANAVEQYFKVVHIKTGVYGSSKNKK